MITFPSQGLGPGNFPVLKHLVPIEDAYEITDFTGTFEFIPVASFLVQSTVLLVMQIICLLSFSTFVSTFKRGPIMVAVFTMIIGVGGYWLITNYPNVIGLGLPFGYLNTIGITTGELMAQTGSGLFRMLPSSIILGLWSIIFILITNLRMTANKDYL